MFRGAIYAPYADVDIAGGAEFMGAVVGRNVTTRGDVPIHRDEDLANSWIVYGDVEILAWREIFSY